MESYWRRVNRALDHINALDRSIDEWLHSDAYRIVKERDAAARRTAYVARKYVPSDWPDLVGDAVHGLRSALDHLAFALNAKGYADTHHGATIPPERESASSFPIVGNVNQRGQPMNGEDAFQSSSAAYRDMPTEAQALIKNLQPYHRGDEFWRDPLWAIHELSRVDKHRIDLDAAASSPTQSTSDIYFEAVDEFVFGVGGPVYDGKELSWWVIPEGAKEPDIEADFTRGVAFGESTPLRQQPVVPTLRAVRDYIRFKAIFPLTKFL